MAEYKLNSNSHFQLYNERNIIQNYSLVFDWLIEKNVFSSFIINREEVKKCLFCQVFLIHLEIMMLSDNNLFQHAAVSSSAYASMAAFTAAANMYNSFYPTINSDPVHYFGCNGKNSHLDHFIQID